MTNEEAEALGRRALAAGFDPERAARGLESLCWCYGPPFIPDFRDPATLGVLVGQSREEAGDRTLCSHAKLYRDGKIWWFVSGENGLETTLYTIEAEAWVAVLEAS
jgi:hypothetical protein